MHFIPESVKEEFESTANKIAAVEVGSEVSIDGWQRPLPTLKKNSDKGAELNQSDSLFTSWQNTNDQFFSRSYVRVGLCSFGA